MRQRVSHASLEAALEATPPRPIGVGRGTVLYLEGRCRHPERKIRDLRVVVGNSEHPVRAHGMSLPGLVAPGDFWWATVPIPPVDQPTRADLALRARLGPGTVAEVELGRLELEPGRVTSGTDTSPVTDRPLVAICMATYEPQPQLFQRQIDSIREQDHPNWICVISD